MGFAVAGRCDDCSIGIIPTSSHIESVNSYRQRKYGDESTISMVCFCASVYESWVAVRLWRIAVERWMGVNCSALHTRLHHIQFGIRLSQSQSSVHIADIAAVHRASPLQPAHIEQWHCIDQTADANYFHAIRAIDPIAVTVSGG